MGMETRQTSISHLLVSHPTAIEISSRLGLREPDLKARHGKPRACLVVICPLTRIRLTSPTWPIRRASRQVFPIGMVVVRSDKKRWSICRCSRSVASIHCGGVFCNTPRPLQSFSTQDFAHSNVCVRIRMGHQQVVASSCGVSKDWSMAVLKSLLTRCPEMGGFRVPLVKTFSSTVITLVGH